MAKYYVDHKAYEIAYGMKLGEVPSAGNFGKPQEGDGSGKYASTASSVGSITLTGGGAGAAGYNLVIAGVVFTLISGARAANSANITIGATDLITCDNAAIAFNDCTTAVAAGVAAGLPRIRDLIYARGPAVRGDSTPRIDIMMRVGSAALNHAANSNVAISSVSWASAPTIVQFIGGVGGCWGVMSNETAIGIGNFYAINTYGLSGSTGTWKPFVPVNSSALTTQVYPTMWDYIWWRSRAGYEIALSQVVPSFARLYHFNLILDSNLEWTEDSGDGVVTYKCTLNNVNVTTIFTGGGYNSSIGCVKQYALRFVSESVAAQNSDWNLQLGNSSNTQVGLFNIYFGQNRDFGNLSLGNPRLLFRSGGYATGTVANCKLDNISRVVSGWTGFVSQDVSDVTFSDCDFYLNWGTTTDPGAIYNGTLANITQILFKNCSFRGAPSTQNYAFRPFSANAAAPGGQAIFENCTGVKLDVYMGFQVARTDRDLSNPMTFVSSADSANGDRWECTFGVCDWNPNSATPYPILNSRQPNGTPWSMKMDWLYYAATAAATSQALPFCSPDMMMLYRDTQAVRTITLEVYARTALGLSAINSAMRVSYIDSTGVLRSENTKYRPDRLTASSSVWTNAASWPNHSAYKYQVTTAYAIKPGTYITVCLTLNSQSPSLTAEQVFFDPEFKVE